MKPSATKALLIAVLFGGVFLFAPVVFAATNDLGLYAISFSEEKFLAGDTVRIYARVFNYGEEDVLARVIFWRGPIAIGNPQFVSARAGGYPEEVFVDFVIPDEPFNVRAAVTGDAPGDQDPENDEKLTAIFEPLPDADRDRITDTKDNCPTVGNAEQGNNDGDTVGDACDPDDDNDGVTDAQEEVAGMDQFDADTDSDGVGDAKDAFPLDAGRSAAPPPRREPEPEPVPELVAVIEPVADQGGSEAEAPAEISGEELLAAVSPVAAEPEDQSSVAKITSRARAAAGDEVATLPETRGNFWNFGNPIVAWIFWILVGGATVCLALERMIGGKYKKMILEDEPAASPLEKKRAVKRKPVRRKPTKKKSAKPPPPEPPTVA